MGQCRSKKVNGQIRWEIILRRKCIGVVYFDINFSYNHIKQLLIDRDGYDPKIVLYASNKTEIYNVHR